MKNKFKILEQFYNEVDLLTKFLSERHKSRLKCNAGCFSCCVDNITVFEVEAENIKSRYSDLLNNEKPYPEGQCAFLNDEGECRIYQHRPYVCRTQGLPLRWIEEINEEQLIEMRDICPLNEENEPLVNISAEDCWTIGPFEEKLATIQMEFSDKPMGENRVALRSLFLSK